LLVVIGGGPKSVALWSLKDEGGHGTVVISDSLDEEEGVFSKV
jgi:hypothetical protein